MSGAAERYNPLMSVTTLFDTLERQQGGASLNSPLVQLANHLVEAAQADYQRMREYEQSFGPSLEREEEDQDALELLRSIWRMFEGWVEEAERVHQRVSRLPAASQAVPALNDLLDNIGRVRARLALSPEDIILGKQQSRRGEVVPVEALRDDLRARRGR
jgi:hypothetical protein